VLGNLASIQLCIVTYTFISIQSVLGAAQASLTFCANITNIMGGWGKSRSNLSATGSRTSSRRSKMSGKSDDDEEVVLRLSLKDIRKKRKNKKEEKEKVTKAESRDEVVSTRSVNLIVPPSTISKASTARHDNTVDTKINKTGSSHSMKSRKSSSGVPYVPTLQIPTEVREEVENNRPSSPETNRTFDHSQALSATATHESSLKKLITEDLWSDNASTVEHSLRKLSAILGKDARSRTMIFKAGGHLAIVQAMKKHRKNAAVQGEGCRALGIAAEEMVNNGSDKRPNENAIAMVGGMDAVLYAMQQFKQEEQIQDFGCGALQNLTGLRENAQQLCDRDGLNVVLGAMRAFPHSRLVQESGCWTIVNLCLRKENKHRIEKAKCFSTVAAILDNHPRADQVKIAAQEALQQLLILLCKR